MSEITKADLLEEAIDCHIYSNEDVSIQEKRYSKSEKKMLCVFVLKINKFTVRKGAFAVVSDEMYNEVIHRVYKIKNKNGIELINKIIALPYIGAMELGIRNNIDNFDYLGDCQVEDKESSNIHLTDRKQYKEDIYTKLFEYTANKLWNYY